jgi:hypothetical protein
MECAMNPDELIHLIRTMRTAREMAEAVRSPETQASHGWDLKRWDCDSSTSAVRFVHRNRRGEPDFTVLCVSRAEECPWVYETTLRLVPTASTLLTLGD